MAKADRNTEQDVRPDLRPVPKDEQKFDERHWQREIGTVRRARGLPEKD